MGRKRDPNKGLSWQKLKYLVIPLVILGIIAGLVLGFTV